MTRRSLSRLRGADAFRSAFRVAPQLALDLPATGGVGLFGWETPEMDGFRLPENDDLILALHLGGSRRVRAVDRSGQLSPGCSRPGLVTLLPPGQAACFSTGGSVRVATLHLARPAELDAGLSALCLPDAPRHFAVDDPFISACLQTLMRTARDVRAPQPDYVRKLTDALLCHLAQWRGLSPPGEHAVIDGTRLGARSLRDLLTHIDANLHRPLGLSELATYMGLSRAAFTRAFRQHLGIPVHRHIVQRRIARARNLLLRSDRELAWIAQELGYSSQSHFTAQFRALTGETPYRFRQRPGATPSDSHPTPRSFS